MVPELIVRVEEFQFHHHAGFCVDLRSKLGGHPHVRNDSSASYRPRLTIDRYLGFVLVNGGTGLLFWGFIVCAIGQTLVYASIAEMASM